MYKRIKQIQIHNPKDPLIFLKKINKLLYL